MIEWLQNWYLNQCNGDWEHEYGITISNVDNPGWSIKIDISNTELDGLEISHSMFEKSDTDWYMYSVEKNIFHGAGDPTKLNKLLEIFKDIYESRTGSKAEI